MSVKSYEVIQYLQAPFNIHVGQIYNSLSHIDTSVKKMSLRIPIMNLSKLIQELETINLEDKMVDSSIFIHCISEIKILIHEIQETNNLINDDGEKILSSFLELLTIFEHNELLNDELFDKRLEEFENMLDDIDFSKISKSRNGTDTSELCQALTDISIGLYGIIGSFGNITEFRWKELFVDNKKFVDCIKVHNLILSQ
tara:strand:- start:179 stop:775 length:597 start_codon:yes stop_codon:yes gene_type:complete